jgi:SAM-dependent methyltransferase
MKTLLKSCIKVEHRWLLRRALTKIRWFGWQRYCPVCKSDVRRFLPGGVVLRLNAICPVCGSAERHRLAWHFIENHTDLLDGREKSLLHVAPEYEISNRLKRANFLDYWTSSFDGKNTRAKIDITQISFPDNHFDAIYCSHVLEHVTEDRKAIHEFWRILRPGRWALLQVPVIPGLTITVEDEAIVDPNERARVYGQWDHVRAYGSDYPDRLREAGFAVTIFLAIDILSPRRIVQWGIDTTEEPIFYCQKPNMPDRLGRTQVPRAC